MLWAVLGHLSPPCQGSRLAIAGEPPCCGHGMPGARGRRGLRCHSARQQQVL